MDPEETEKTEVETETEEVTPAVETESEVAPTPLGEEKDVS